MKLLFTLLLICSINEMIAQERIDYSKQENWAVLPWHTPENLLSQMHDTSLLAKADVFYIYPTLMLDAKDKRWNMPMMEQEHMNDVLNSAVQYQASAWAEAGRMYVPYYRQAHIRSYYTEGKRGEQALMYAYADIKASFEYYMEHYNQGRPIILAGHSQGSTQLYLLIKDFFEGKALQKQLIAAYMPGIGFDKDVFKDIPLMTRPNQTGGFVAWNTFKKKIDKESYNKWYKGKAVVNPVTWDLSPMALKKDHLGFYFSNGKLYPHMFDTHLIDGGIWISTPKWPFQLMSLTMKNYHIGDINLFWEDIRLNAKLRVESYLNLETK